ncbi:asparagine synthase C-terminal domain-containing protein [Pseudoxanthomonas sp. X-1]|uniref:asparagine synthase-related protein n=1 Tax=Pseudoxanthomonas sp. X-1 TaxID=2571115 RepID=UPI00110AFE30|nr:asparagine synthase C-terminal domain-containing protein [Pseudoxanthomonas sp. X-1]TMN24201.1 asparagine synthase [Pseudoxanthomonas sp. X-1]UAY75165.1 asparagine synthase C-terminal domain-containing protein [Pseudoxanthomonas sp. X-1]
MSCSYVVLVEREGPAGCGMDGQTERGLENAGMRLRCTLGPVKVFAQEQTSILLLPGNGVLIGRLFTSTGRSVADGGRLPALAQPSQLREHLLKHFWGEYVLVQPPIDGAAGITVTRDPSGGVGCVYVLRNGSGFVASDISVATAAGLYRKQIDWDSIAYLLTFPNHKVHRTALVDVHELLPGCSLQLCGQEITRSLIWSPWNHVAAGKRHRDFSEAAADVRSAVLMVIKAWAKIDRSILLELSGGLDSSIVGVCLRQARVRVACCTLVTPVPGADERHYAEQIANRLGVNLHAVELKYEDARFDFASPAHLANPSITALQHATDSAFDAMGDSLDTGSFYSGGGGDTVFAFLGTAAPAADAVRECGLSAGVAAVRDLSALHECTFWKAARLTARKLARRRRNLDRPDGSFLNRARISLDAQDHPWFAAAPADALPGDRERIFDLAGTQAFRDYLPRGMRRPLRMPLLSQPVVEACLRVPTWMWIRDGLNRAVARAAFADMLPRDILERRSKGTFVNFSGGIYRRGKDRIREFLLTGVLREHGMLDTDALKAFFATDLRSGDQSLQRIYDLCMVENWVRQQS